MAELESVHELTVEYFPAVHWTVMAGVGDDPRMYLDEAIVMLAAIDWSSAGWGVPPDADADVQPTRDLTFLFDTEQAADEAKKRIVDADLGPRFGVTLSAKVEDSTADLGRPTN